ncbi:hypothetical protein P4114_00430 [Pseudomonas aeruginosa]|nr:hypothetical protein [Pseudomonas aeruginosa]
MRPAGCKVKTSVKVRHYVPDAVVSNYANTGSNPGPRCRRWSTPNPLAQAGNGATTNYKAENGIGRFTGSGCDQNILVGPRSAGSPAPLGTFAWRLPPRWCRTFSAHWTPLAGGMDPSRCTWKRSSQGCARWGESPPATGGNLYPRS